MLKPKRALRGLKILNNSIQKKSKLTNQNFYIFTLGCKINIYESEAIAGSLIKKGLSNVIDPKKAQIIIINSCTVTVKAGAKTRNIIRKLKKENGKAILIVCGCLVNIDKENLEKIDEIDILIVNKDKDKIYEIISDYQETCVKIKPLYFNSDTDGSFNFSVSSMQKHSRAFLKIQDGCNNYCSFCTIPYARGNERSRDIEEIYNEIDKLIIEGFEEFVLSGINLGSYNFKNIDLNKLLVSLADRYKSVRFRISSIEPQYINAEFVDVFKINNICPHIHIPLQSASNKILKLMNRKYSINEYIEKIEMIRSSKNDPFISTDLIIGFPGEDEKYFLETIDIIKKIKFAFIHLFGFSPRENTTAFTMTPKVPERIRDQRLDVLKHAVKEMNLDYRRKFLNKKLEVLIERKKDKYYYGKTENYIDLAVSTDIKLENRKRYKIIFTKIDDDKNFGKLQNNTFIKIKN